MSTETIITEKRPIAMFNFFSQFTEEQIKNQYRENLKGLIKMRDKAERLGKKVNGYTLDQLNEAVLRYTKLAE